MTLQSSFDELERTVEESEAFFQQHFGDGDFVYNLVLLASEAVTNAIEHGNKEVVERKVDVWLAVDPEFAIITVEDEGSGFDPNRVADPLAPDNLFADGGRGVFLMESMADEVDWSNEGRKVALKVRIPQ